MEYYSQTGQVLGKGTHDLEGYTLHEESTGKYATGYFGPGELPTFNAEFFKIPNGTPENAALEDLIDYIKDSSDDLDQPEGQEKLFDFRDRLKAIVSAESVSDSTMF